LARNGQGIPVNYKDAYFHFRLAVLQGGVDAERVIKGDMERLAAKISDQERQTEVAAADTWFQHHSLRLVFIYKNRGVQRDFPSAAMTYAPEGSFAGQLVPLGSS
jgi:TPR repeat protein